MVVVTVGGQPCGGMVNGGGWVLIKGDRGRRSILIIVKCGIE